MAEVILHLGSNEGDRVGNLNIALSIIQKEVGDINAKSLCYETEPWGNKEQPNFLNLAISLNCEVTPAILLDKINKIEKELGRDRKIQWGARSIDIDIIFYDDLIIDTKCLTIPHKELQNRNFVLIPLMDIDGHRVHPVLNKNIEELYLESKDTCEVYIFETAKFKYK